MKLSELHYRPPKKLKYGDTIGIVSPSDPVKENSLNLLEKGIEFLNNLGFKTILGDNISSENPQEKAKDINNFFSDNNISAIICTQGGNSAEKTLPYIDWVTIKQNPKIFMGISDNTVILNAINFNSGLITFHGNDVCYGFGRNPSKYDLDEFNKTLIAGKIGEVKPNRPRKTIRSGKASGKILGGNIRCLLKLIDTDFWPDFSDSILILEAFRLDKSECSNLFKKLKEKGVFDKINGVVVGYIYGMQKENPKGIQMENLLLEFTKGFSFPILKVNDFGHNCPNTTIPIGGKMKLDADNKIITITENCVK